jgi:hypothetical protein
MVLIRSVLTSRYEMVEVLNLDSIANLREYIREGHRVAGGAGYAYQR